MHWHDKGGWLLKLMSLYCCSLSLYPAAATSRGYLAKLDLTAKVIILLDESRWLVGAAHSQVSPIYWECIIHWVYQGLTRSLKTGQTYYVLQIYDKYIYDENCKMVDKIYAKRCLKNGPLKFFGFTPHINFLKSAIAKVHIFWEGHKILQNLHFTFDWQYIGQKISQS